MRGLPYNIKALEDVAMVQSGKGLNFAIEHFATDGILYSFHVDGFDGYGLV
jgi:hypothetical protein